VGSAVSAITNVVKPITNMISGGGSSVGSSLGNLVSNPTGIGGGAIGDLVKGIVPEVPLVDQGKLQTQINNVQGLANRFTDQQAQQQAIANQQYGMAQQGVGVAQNAVQNAQQVNQGPGSNVNAAVGLLGQTAAGGGAAQQAANAQLRAGTDEAIRTQQAMANSGNLSQMIGGQRAAMTNAGQLQQKNALDAAALQAGMAASAQGQYAGAAGQQAGQAAQNAQLQQAQTAQQADLAGMANQQAQGYAGNANQAQGTALAGQTSAQDLAQGAAESTAKYRAQALGGMMNAGGGAMALMSDENLKTDIKNDSKGIKSFLDAVDPVSFDYKDSDGKKGRTEGKHLGVIAQQIEKAPGGASMIVEMPEGKGIDIPSAVGTLLAASADINNRMNSMEELFKSRSESRKKK
jgi:hypothetical protein